MQIYNAPLIYYHKDETMINVVDIVPQKWIEPRPSNKMLFSLSIKHFNTLFLWELF
jgi:hypothetical protein